MRTYGRVYDKYGNYTWVEVDTDQDGLNDAVYLTTLAQVFKLGRGESPFYSNYGIPAQQSVIQQIFPDYYVNQTQTQFAPLFASLQIASLPGTEPVYAVSVTTNSGAQISFQVPI